jgi:hypothetical protein
MSDRLTSYPSTTAPLASPAAGEPGASAPRSDVTARMQLLERLLASRPDHGAAAPKGVQIVRVAEWLVALMAMAALSGAAVLAYQLTQATSPIPGGTRTILALGAGLAVLAGVLTVGGGWWDAALLKLFRRQSRTIPVRDRWLTLIGAVLLLGGAVFELATAASMKDAPPDDAPAQIGGEP